MPNKSSTKKYDLLSIVDIWFCLWFVVPSLAMLVVWLALNARGVGDGTGHAFQLLFHPRDLFTDWLIPHAWALEDNPWLVVGSPYENKLPPSSYGPAIFMILRYLLPGAAVLTPAETIFHVLFASTLVAVGSLLILYAISKKSKNVPNWSILLVAVSMPIVFALNRGNTVVIMYFFAAILAVLLVRTKGLLWLLPLCWLAFSSWQLLPILLIPFLFERSRRAYFLLLCAALPVVIFVYNSHVSLQHLKIGYELTLVALRVALSGARGAQMHDFASAFEQLSQLPFGSLATNTMVVLLGAIAFLPLAFYSGKAALGFFQFMRLKNRIDISSSVTRDLIYFALFLYIIITLLVSKPSADYHLLRIVPFIGIGFVYYEDDFAAHITKPIIVLVAALLGLCFSYSRAWWLLTPEPFGILRTFALVALYSVVAIIFAAKCKHAADQESERAECNPLIGSKQLKSGEAFTS